MKKLLWLFLVLVLAAPAAYADGALAVGFVAAASSTGIPNIGTGIGYHKLTWNVSGTVATCTVALDTSVDGITWSAGGAITGQTCTSNGTSATTNVVANFVRINVTVFSGTGSVNVTWNGYVNVPLNPASPGPIGGTTPAAGTFTTLLGKGPIADIQVFGAKCDGTTDDAIAIQAALDSGAGTVRVPAATCIFGTGLQINDYQFLTGVGQNSILMAKGNTAFTYGIRNKAINGTIQGWGIRDLQIQGNQSSSTTFSEGVISIQGTFQPTFLQTLIIGAYTGAPCVEIGPGTVGSGGSGWITIDDVWCSANTNSMGLEISDTYMGNASTIVPVYINNFTADNQGTANPIHIVTTANGNISDVQIRGSFLGGSSGTCLNIEGAYESSFENIVCSTSGGTIVTMSNVANKQSFANIFKLIHHYGGGAPTNILVDNVNGYSSGATNLAEYTMPGYTANINGTLIPQTAGSLLTSSSSLTQPVGLVNAPTYSWVGHTSSGMYWNNGGIGPQFSNAGVDIFGFGGTGIQEVSTMIFGWSSAGLGGSYDIALSRDSAGVLDVGTGAAASKAASVNLTNLVATGQLTDSIATGTAPLVITSTTPVANLTLTGMPKPVASTTPVTASNPTINTDTALIQLSLGAGFLNTASQVSDIKGSGIYTSTTASTPALTIKAKLCTVSGCGSGTVVTLFNIVTTALNTVAIVNATWNLTGTCVTNTTGATGNLVCHGSPGLVLDTGASLGIADSVFADTNTATLSNIDLTAALFLQFTVAQSVVGASNSYVQQLAAIR
jgi:hypothetical protein